MLSGKGIWWYGAAATLATAAAYSALRGPDPPWPCAWVAPAPVLAFALAAPWRAAATAAFAAYGLSAAGLFALVSGFVPAPLVAGYALVSAAAFTAIVMATRAAVLRLARWPVVFAYPVLSAAYEHLSALAALPTIAASQADFPAAIQIAAWTGGAGVAFLLALPPSALAVAWHLRGRGESARLALAVPALLCALALGFGWWRLAQPSAQPTVRVGLAATDTTVRFFRTERADEALAVVDAYARRVAALAARGADVVVLPEKFVGVAPPYADAVRDLLAAAARRHRVWVVAGLNRIVGPPRRNVALVLDPQGRVALEYDKVHLVPSFEDGYHSGRAPATIDAGRGTWGVAICRDVIFTDVGRANARAGADLLLVPAWDFVTDGYVQSRLAALRAVESGMALVRVAQEGRVMASDDRGRILFDRATGDAAEVLTVVTLPLGRGPTFYARRGDWFGWGMVAGAAALLASLALPPRRRA